MKLVVVALLLSTSNVFAQSNLNSYLEEVKKFNPQYKSTLQASEGAKLRATEGTLLILPELSIDVSRTVDETEPTAPMGDKNTYELYSLGISQNTTFGLAGKLSYGHGYTFTENSTVLPPAYSNGYHRASPSIELSQSLWKNGFGSEVRATRSAINAAARAKQFEERAKNLAVLIEAQNAYSKLYYTQKTVQAFQESMEVAGKLRSWAKKRLDQSLGEQSDYYQTKATYELRELEYLSALQEEKTAARAFNSLKGESSDVVTAKLEAPPLPTYQKQSFSEKIWRDDVRAANKAAEASKANSLMGKEKNRPTLDLYGKYALTGLDPDGSAAHDESLTDDHPVYTVGIKLVVPLAFTKSNDVIKGYEQEALAADLSFKRKAQEQERDFNDLVSRIDNATLRLKLASSLEESQRIKVQAERKRHGRGRTTFFQVLQFEQDYLSSQLNKIKTEAELNMLLTQSQMYRGE